MDDLERLLSSEDPLVPSSGFTARVMDAVREEALGLTAATPFPWKSFVVGSLAAGVCAGAGAAVLTSEAVASTVSGLGSLTGHLLIAAVGVLISLTPVYGRRLLARH